MPEVLVRPTSLDLQPQNSLKYYEVVTLPDLGGEYQGKFNIHDAIVFAQPGDRNLPPITSQETQIITDCNTTFSLSGSIDFTPDLIRVDKLRTDLGIPMGQRWSHDPAVDRARFERAKTDEEKQVARQGVIVDMERNLYERAHTAQSTVIYRQNSNGRIYSQDFLNEPFDITLQRGLRDREGSVDYQRELAESEGLKEVMLTLFDKETPMESKAIVLSPPSEKKKTSFTDNFVDIFTKALDLDTGEVVVVMTRFASGANYDEYKKAAVYLQGDYFSLKGDKEADVYFKRHPIFIDVTADSRDSHQLFDEEFKKQTGATKEKYTRHYINECKLFILSYAEAICSEFFEPEKVKKSFNAVLNKFDSLGESVVETVANFAKTAVDFGRSVISKISDLTSQARDSLNRAIDHYGNMMVKVVMGGCGASSGFATGGVMGSLLKAGRGIASVLGIGGIEHKWFVCPKCEYRANGPVGNSCPGCGLTKEAYSQSGGKVC